MSESSNFNGTGRSLRESDGIQGQSQGQEIVEGKEKTNEAEGSNEEATSQVNKFISLSPWYC
jgi:hypothetical protein